MKTTPARPAFTLVELLVVCTLILLLASLAILIMPGVNDNARAARGATQVQQWLAVAKQARLRDRAPRGVRLLVDGNFVTAMQYIEQPDDYAVPATSASGYLFRPIKVTASTDAGGVTTTTAVLQGTITADFTGGQIQANDYLEFNGVGLSYRIASVTNATTLVLTSSPLGNPAAGATVELTTQNYRIIRAPRATADEQLLLPEGIAIDTNPIATGAISLLPLKSGSNPWIDILFSPSGAVLGNGSDRDAIYLWVRDITLQVFEGENTIIALFPRTGATAAHPADPISGDPYTFAKEGRGS